MSVKKRAEAGNRAKGDRRRWWFSTREIHEQNHTLREKSQQRRRGEPQIPRREKGSEGTAW